MDKDNHSSPTILEFQSKLFDYFAKHNTFEVDRDFDEICTISIDKNRDKAAIVKALNSFQEAKLISCCFNKDKEYWILNCPLSSQKQSLDINGDTVQLLTATINAYCESIGDRENLANPLAIKEQDIRNLILICHKVVSDKINKQV